MKRYFIAFALLATPISGAFAADAVVDLPVASTFDWNGAYLGGQAGYGWGRADNSFPSNPAAEISGSVDGGFGGLYGGWNIQNGNFVGGIDADINYSGIKGTSTNAATGESLNTKVTWTGDIRGRVGYAMDNLLIYGAGGLALGGIKVNVSNAGGTFASASETRAGWTLGAGAEMRSRTIGSVARNINTPTSARSVIPLPRAMARSRSTPTRLPSASLTNSERFQACRPIGRRVRFDRRCQSRRSLAVPCSDPPSLS